MKELTLDELERMILNEQDTAHNINLEYDKAVAVDDIRGIFRRLKERNSRLAENLVIASEQQNSTQANGAVADVVNQLRDEFDRMINGYKTVHIGYGIEVANCQFLEKQSVDNYFSNILPGYLEKLLRVTASL